MKRPKPRVKLIEPAKEELSDEQQFVVHPASDLPKNKLIEKLARGLQSYIQRMQKREGFRLEIKHVKESKWTPAPRECATLCTSDIKMFMFGGLNFDAVKEVV